jgi:hypothetical protein
VVDTRITAMEAELDDLDGDASSLILETGSNSSRSDEDEGSDEDEARYGRESFEKLPDEVFEDIDLDG